MHRAPASRRPIAWAIALAVLLTTAAGSVPALGATGGELRAARERIDRTSAELARARSRAERTGGDELAALERIERRLQAEKAELLRLESGLAARHAAEGAADGSVTEAPAAEASDDPLIVLADAPAPAAPAAPVTPTATGQSTQEVVPAVTGPAAGLAARIDGYLASKASPLTGLGAVFVTESSAVGLDPRFLVAISGAETSFGTYGPSQGIHNPFGMGPGISYPSWSASIAAAARNLGGPIYAGDGRVMIGTIQQRWAPAGASNDPTDLNSNWARNVATYYSELGGNPQGAVFTGAATVAAASAAPAAGAQQQSAVVTSAYGLPVATPVLGASGLGPQAAPQALAALGPGWAEGGHGTGTGFDDAGLVYWAFRRQGVEVPAGRTAQARAGTAVAPQDLQAGDAVFFSDEQGRVDHEGLYVGAGQFVHAPGEHAVVGLASLYDPAHAQAYAGARRY